MSEVFKMWVYHKDEEAKIINSDEFSALKKKGWKDSPVVAKKEVKKPKAK